jgi:hypothetical protein
MIGMKEGKEIETRIPKICHRLKTNLPKNIIVLTFTEMKERNENTLTLRGEREVWKP